MASATSDVGVPGFAPGARWSSMRFVASGLLVGNWKRVMPMLFQAMPQKPPAVPKTSALPGPYQSRSHLRSIMELIGPREKLNPILAVKYGF